MGYNPQESLENTINTMGTLLGVHPIVPWTTTMTLAKTTKTAVIATRFRLTILYKWRGVRTIHQIFLARKGFLIKKKPKEICLLSLPSYTCFQGFLYKREMWKSSLGQSRSIHSRLKKGDGRLEKENPRENMESIGLEDSNPSPICPIQLHRFDAPETYIT